MIQKIIVWLSLVFNSICWSHPDIDKRIEIISEKIIYQPNNGELLLSRAELHLQHGNWNAAILDVEQAKTHNADIAKIYFYFAQIYRQKNDLKKSIQYYHKSITEFDKSDKSNSLRALSHIALAEIYQYKKQWEMAAQEFEKAIKHSSNASPVIYHLCAIAYLFANHSKHAKQILLQGVKLYPKNIAINRILIEIEVNERNFQNAQSITINLLKHYPKLGSKLKFSLSELQDLQNQYMKNNE